uniref:CSON002202 protein n=1 Tax=Culicoides sonorensis TaxID=179676 RepID=A0A336MIW4_CULSO
MAKNKCTVLLGYEDDFITDKQKHFIDYTTNKVGGKPDWPSSEIYVPSCTLCAGARRLIVQIYAPLENSSFHRTLYLFSCLNPPCSNQSEGWLCMRTEILEKNYHEKEGYKVSTGKKIEKIEWCTGADDWGDEMEGDDTSLDTNTNSNEENGNVVISVENNQKCDNRMSDEDDESNSLGSDPLIPGFNNLGIDDRNANAALAGAYAIEKQVPSPSRPTAEIEGAESEVILIDMPQAPQKDVIKLLTNAPMFNQIPQDQVIKSFFISVDEEQISDKIKISEHVRELLVEYEMRDDTLRTSPDDPNVGAGNNMDEGEIYERGIPVHGDLMFHNFLSRIQENPGQMLRYSREAAPLLIGPLKETIQKCQNCGGDVICELQVLPSLIPKLKFENNEAVPIDFGNVLVYTCMKSCWDTPDKMRLEKVIVQQEELPPELR